MPGLRVPGPPKKYKEKEDEFWALPGLRVPGPPKKLMMKMKNEKRVLGFGSGDLVHLINKEDEEEVKAENF